MSDKGWHVLQVFSFLAAGIGCMFLGQVPIGMTLIGAAIGNAGPTNLLAGAGTPTPPTPQK